MKEVKLIHANSRYIRVDVQVLLSKIDVNLDNIGEDIWRTEGENEYYIFDTWRLVKIVIIEDTIEVTNYLYREISSLVLHFNDYESSENYLSFCVPDGTSLKLKIDNSSVILEYFKSISIYQKHS